MYAYTFSSDFKHIVGRVDTKEEFDKLPDIIKKDLELVFPNAIYNESDEDEIKIQKLFCKADRYWEFWESDGKIFIEIDGDWKHDHRFCQTLMGSLGYKCEDEILLEDSDSDWYYARHVYSKV